MGDEEEAEKWGEKRKESDQRALREMRVDGEIWR